MTASKPQTENPKKPEGELSDATLDQASGGALNAYLPAVQQPQTSTGGAAGKAMGDGSVRTNSALIGLL